MNRLALFMMTLLCVAVVSAEQTDTLMAPALSPADRQFFEQLARKVEPQLLGDASKLNRYVRFYQQELANDDRLFAFQVSAAVDPTDEMATRLSGYVEFPEHRLAVGNMLRVLGFEILANDITVLPDEELGELCFGLLTASSSLSFDQPSGDRNVVSECLIGEPLFLLKKVKQYYLCHSGEGYLGYVAVRDVRQMSESEFAAYAAGDRVVVLASHQVGKQWLPAGARLKLISSTNKRMEVQLPDGTVTLVSSPQCQLLALNEPAIEQIIATGKSLLGTEYLWGGKTSRGIDCSGLIQVAFRAAGLQLPRDSNQQFFLGHLTATRWCTSTMHRGDTMYFLGKRGRIRHTAIYLGDGQYLHAQLPAVTISSLDPEHPAYDAKRHASFAFAKRLMD